MIDFKYSVTLPEFEGSLDLLLHLIKVNKIDIYDIPIALITKQYLDYLDIMKELDLNIASDFIVMASTLIYIKSRMLLPPDEIEEDNQLIEDDPRTPLVERLLEYQVFKEASLRLKELEERRGSAFTRPFNEGLSDATDDILVFSETNIFDLIEAVKKVFQNLTPAPSEISREVLTIKDRISLIMDIIESKSVVTFQELFNRHETRIEIIITFVSLLELIKMRLVKAFQSEEFGTIWIVKAANANRKQESEFTTL